MSKKISSLAQITAEMELFFRKSCENRFMPSENKFLHKSILPGLLRWNVFLNKKVLDKNLHFWGDSGPIIIFGWVNLVLKKNLSCFFDPTTISLIKNRPVGNYENLIITRGRFLSLIPLISLKFVPTQEWSFLLWIKVSVRSYR